MFLWKKPVIITPFFIDSNNLYISIRQQGWKLDFRRFRKYLYDKYSVTKAFLGIGYVRKNRRLYEALKEDGYELIFKKTLKLPDGRVKGNVDAELILQAMVEYNNYEKAVIVSNDGDFSCLVEYLQKQNKLLRLIIPDRNNYSSLLTKFSAHIAFMNDMEKKLKYRKKKDWEASPRDKTLRIASHRDFL